MTKNDDPRSEGADRVLCRRVGRGGAKLDALPADASFRRYFRLTDAKPPMLLMDAPPPKEDVRPFIRVARHLLALGLSAPRIYDVDVAQGFALIEDFGDGTYSRLLDSGADPVPLYRAATDALILLHAHPDGAAYRGSASYDTARLLSEASELPEWYGLAITGARLPPTRDRISSPSGAMCWPDAAARNRSGAARFPRRQFDAVAGASTGAAACGLLDFQDALIGPKPYDLLCLLRNERRGMEPALSDALYAHYTARCPPADPDGFALWYRVLAAQRYAKVVGRFARLTLRDGRNGYLKYLPRFLMLLEAALADEPLLAPIRRQLDRILPDWKLSPPDNPAALRQRVAPARGGS